MVFLLLAGFVAGVIAATMALATGFSWIAAFGFYVLGGNIGLLLTGTLIARSRTGLDMDVGIDAAMDMDVQASDD